MGVTIVGIYLKLNIILFLAFLIWSGAKKIAQIFNFSLSSNKELEIARIFFLLSLTVPVVFSIFGAALVTKTDMASMTVIGQSISSGIDSGLETQINLAGQDIATLWVVLTLLAMGVANQCINSFKKYRQLRLTLIKSISWKNINGVRIMFSQEITTPFSTRVLGVNQVILPYQLLESPRNFRLAVKHELQHIRNGDLYWVLLLELIKPLLFWNPVFYAWLNEFHCLQEYACDEALVNKPSVNANNYGHCLLEVACHSFDAPLFASSNMVPIFALFGNTQSQLKRRIIMMSQVQNKRFQTAKITVYSAVLTLGLTGISINALKAAEEEKPNILPIITVQPVYPTIAMDRDIEGWVLVELTVNKEGSVIEPSIIASCYNREFPARDASNLDNCASDDLLDSSSLDAISKFKFQPKMVNGNYSEVPGVKYLFNYALSN